MPAQSDSNEEDGALIDALVAQGKLLSEQGYTFWAPTPETHDKVIARLSDERGSSRTHTLASEKDQLSLRASTSRDVFGWSMPIESDSPLLNTLDPNFTTRCVSGSGDQQSSLFKSTVRYSSLYPSAGYTSSGSSSTLYAHSSWPTKDDKDAIFFGPDTYRFLRYLTASFTRFTTGRSFELGIDVGCGAGAGAIHLANDTGVGCHRVVGLDINPRALLFAKANAKLYTHTSPRRQSDNTNGEEKLDWRISDLLSALSREEKEQLDLVISNPPYIAFEPSSGGGSTYADGGDQKGLALPIQIAREAIAHLKVDGLLILYTGVPIGLDGVDPLRTTLLEDAFFQEHSEMLDYEVLDVDAWGDELRDAHGSYGRSDVGQIAIVGTVLRRR